MIRGIGVGFRDAVSLIMWRTWLGGGAKSKALLSGRSQAFLQTPCFFLAMVVCAQFCLSMCVGCGDESWGQDDVM